MATNFINCTPHPIVVVATDGVHITFEPSGVNPRCETIRTPGGIIGGAPSDVGGFRLVLQTKGGVEGLPEGEAGVVLIVSGMVLDALCGSRPDVVAPDTGKDCIRNDKGHIVAVRGFVQ